MKKLAILVLVFIGILFYLYYPSGMRIDLKNNIQSEDERRYQFKVKILPEGSKVPVRISRNNNSDTFTVYDRGYLLTNFLRPLYGKTDFIWSIGNKDYSSKCGFLYRGREDLNKVKIIVDEENGNIIVKWRVTHNIFNAFSGVDTLVQN